MEWKNKDLSRKEISNDQLNNHSQFEIARVIMDQKRYAVKNDVEVQMAGYILDTIGCETETDFLNKYHGLLDKIGISHFSVNKKEDKKNGVSYNINVDLDDSTRYHVEGQDSVEDEEAKQISLSTSGCDDITDFIEMNQEALNKFSPEIHDQIIERAKMCFKKEFVTLNTDLSDNMITILKKMIEKKNDEKKDVTCTYNDINLSTENCKNLGELYLKYQEEIFKQYEENRTRLLEEPKMQQVIASFQNSDVDSFKDYGMDNRLNNEYTELLMKGVDLDFNNPIVVNNWLDSLKKYINNHKLGFNIHESNKVLQMLKEHGYSSEKQEVNTLDDFYKRFISYEMQDLEKYHFFATDYADAMENNMIEDQELDNLENNIIEETKNILGNSAEESEQELIQETQYDFDELQKEYQKLQFLLLTLDAFENGIINNFTNRMTDHKNKISFDVKKARIKQQIEELKYKKMNTTPTVDVAEDFSQAKVKLENMSISKEEEKKAKQVYDTATAFPDTDNIIKALESAASLPDDSEIKKPLIDTIVKLNDRYASSKDEDEVKLIQDTIDKLNIQPSNNINSSIDEEITRLENELLEINQEQQQRIKRMKPKKEAIQNRLSEIERIFSDESRIDPKDSWMEQGTAQSLGKYNSADDFTPTLTSEPTPTSPVDDKEIINNNPVVDLMPNNIDNIFEEEQVTVESDVETAKNNLITTENGYDLTPKEDSLLMPRIIKSIKKAPASIKSKIQNFHFKEKMKAAVKFIKEHPIFAIATAGALAGIIVSTALSNEKGISSIENTKFINHNNNEKQQEDILQTNELETSTNTNTIESQVVEAPNIQQQPGLNLVMEEKSDDELFEAELQNTINNILDGEITVHISADRAARDIDGKTPTASQLENSWATATPGAFYNVENGVVINPMTAEEAKDYWQDGGQVVVRWDNERGTAGFATLENQDTNETGMTK